MDSHQVLSCLKIRRQMQTSKSTTNNTCCFNEPENEEDVKDKQLLIWFKWTSHIGKTYKHKNLLSNHRFSKYLRNQHASGDKHLKNRQQYGQEVWSSSTPENETWGPFWSDLGNITYYLNSHDPDSVIQELIHSQLHILWKRTLHVLTSRDENPSALNLNMCYSRKSRHRDISKSEQRYYYHFLTIGLVCWIAVLEISL